MVAVTETSPGTQPSINQKQDSQSVPVGQDDLWVDAGDMNVLGGHVVSIMRAFRATAILTGVAPATETLIDKAFRFLTIDAVSGLGRASTNFATDLNKAMVAGVESIQGNGGSLSGTASNTGFFGVHRGLLSGTSGTFVTGRLYTLSAGGGLVTHTSGALAPFAIGLDAKTAYFDAGGRFLTDDSTIEFNANGVMRVKSGAQFTLGDTDINGTLTVSGATTLSGGLTVNGSIDTDTTYRVSGTTVIDSNRNIFRGAEADIVAGTVQTQASGFMLTRDINDVGTVATADDTVVMPTAVAGREVFIKNNGTNRLQIFPAVGDNLDGAGVDTAITLEPDSSISFKASDATNWEQAAGSGAGSMLFDNLASLFITGSVSNGGTLSFSLTAGQVNDIGPRGIQFQRLTILPSVTIAAFDFEMYEKNTFLTADRSVQITGINNSASSPTTYVQRGAIPAIDEDAATRLNVKLHNNGSAPATFSLGWKWIKLR